MPEKYVTSRLLGRPIRLSEVRRVNENRPAQPDNEGESIPMTDVVHELLAQDHVTQDLDEGEKELVRQINLLKGRDFNGNPGRIIAVFEIGSIFAEQYHSEFDLTILLVALAYILKEGGLTENIESLDEIDAAWNKYIDSRRPEQTGIFSLKDGNKRGWTEDVIE